MMLVNGSTYAVMGWFHVALARHDFDGPDTARDAIREAIDTAARTGNLAYEMLARSDQIDMLSDTGEWDEVLKQADFVLEWALPRVAQSAVPTAVRKARVLALRGDLTRAEATMVGVLDRATAMIDPQFVNPAMVTSALIHLLRGRHREGLAMLGKFRPEGTLASGWLAEVTRLRVARGVPRGFRRFLDEIPPGPPMLEHNLVTARAAVSEAAGDTETAAAGYADAVERWRAFRNPYELAHALLGQARCLEAIDPGRARELRGEADGNFARLGVDTAALSVLLGARPGEAKTLVQRSRGI
jgi:hypothetical protein